VGILCNLSDEGIGSEGYIAYSVAFSLLLIRHILDGKIFDALNGEEKIGVAAGFNSGDLFCVGELTKNGLRLRNKALGG
jgi:hypothetical protein